MLRGEFVSVLKVFRLGRACVPSNAEPSFFIDIPEHIVESYRVPEIGDSFEEYRESDRAWKLVGFGLGITNCQTLDDAGMRGYRNLLMHYCHNDPDMYALLCIAWPDWVPNEPARKLHPAGPAQAESEVDESGSESSDEESSEGPDSVARLFDAAGRRLTNRAHDFVKAEVNLLVEELDEMRERVVRARVERQPESSEVGRDVLVLMETNNVLREENGALRKKLAASKLLGLGAEGLSHSGP